MRDITETKAELLDAGLFERAAGLFFDRFLLPTAFLYALGILFARLWLEKPIWAGLTAILFMLLMAAGLRFRKIGLYKAVLLLLVSLTGGVSFYFAVAPPAGGILDYSGTVLSMEGVVVSDPLHYEGHTAFHLRVEAIIKSGKREALTADLLVKIYGPVEEHYRFGEKLRLRGAVVEPRGVRNPGGFDYRLHLRSRGIDALVYPRSGQVESIGRAEPGRLFAWFTRMRGALGKEIAKTLPSPSAELLTAMLFGERQRLPGGLEEAFRRSGTGHLLAVSGLHVGLVAVLVLGFFRKIKLRGAFPFYLAPILVFAYAFLTGPSPSALRAAVMVSGGLLALALDRSKDLPASLALAALITLFYNPLLLFEPGFQFSYAATFAVIYAYKPFERLIALTGCPRLLLAPLAVTLAAQFGVIPLSLYHFHHLPTGGLLFNLLFMPLMPFIIGLGLAGAISQLFVLPLGELLLWAARPLLETMVYTAGLSSHPAFYVALRPPNPVALLLYYTLFSALLFCYYHWLELRRNSAGAGFGRYFIEGFRSYFLTSRYTYPMFLAVLVAAGVYFWALGFVPGKDHLTVYFLDVGQGHAALIETPCGATILVDAGGVPAYRGDPGVVGEQVILPFLRLQGIGRIDLAVVTHPHEDHYGGFIPLVGRVAIDKMLLSPVTGEAESYMALIESAQASGTVISLAEAGQVWRCGPELALNIIGPPAALYRGTGSDLNNNSIVFILAYKDVKMLFPGDIEDFAAQNLLRSGKNMNSHVLLVPHHGGYMEAMPDFLAAVQPAIAVIQVGSNPFGHPHPFVLNSLAQAGIKVLRNDQHGAVTITTDGDRIWVETVTRIPASLKEAPAN